MTAELFIPPSKALDANANPYAGAKWFFYATGTTTPQSVYTTFAMGTPHANPVVADSSGKFANIFFDPALVYRGVLKNADESVTLHDIDPISSSTLAALAASGGSALVGFSHAETYAAGTAGAKFKNSISVTDAPYNADPTGAVDCTAAVQAAITAGNITFPPGDYTMSWAAISADVLIPANRKIEVQKGATITNTGGRFTAHNVDNVEWLIDGWVKSVAIRVAANRPLVEGTTDNERGFIEFSEDFVVGSAADNFKVHGTGKVSGDWVGTPNVSDLANQVNKKGIACWNSKNVLVNGLEVFGFEGEAIYAFFFDNASHNIVFSNNNVHDCRFNGLNFNAGANSGGCKIIGNRVKNVYQVESSVGEISDNDIQDTISYGIFTGAGVGLGPVSIKRNIIKRTGITAIGAINSSVAPSVGLEVCDNTIISAGQYSIFVDYFNEITITGNSCTGSGTTGGSYDIGIQNVLRGAVADNKFFSPGAFSAGRVAVVPANVKDVEIINNVYSPTSGLSVAYQDDENVRRFQHAKTLANGDEIIFPSLVAGQYIKLVVASPAGNGVYIITSASAGVMPGSDGGYSIGGAGSVTVELSSGTAYKIRNVSGGNTFPFFIEGWIVG